MNPTQDTGYLGEQTAAKFLEAKGYKILERNVRTPYGEIDLIAAWNQPRENANEPTETIIVFVEVKTRRTKTFGPPEVSITPRKRIHLLSSIQYYIQQNPTLGKQWRLDVITIEKYRTDRHPVITHFENAFSD